MPDQLALFGEDEAPRGAGRGEEALRARHDRLRPVAAALPPLVRFGTSSWSFPGWRGLVYQDACTTAHLAREGLREYVRHPLLTTVGIDRSFYAPIPEDDLRRYAEQLPAGFPCCCKAPGAVTSALVAGRRSMPGAESRDEPNPDFLSAERFTTEMLEPFGRVFRGHTGPFILQFSPMLRRAPIEPAAFHEALDRFLAALPRDFQYAVELRDRALLSPVYADVLARHRAAHVYNFWTAVPRPAEQAADLPPERMPFVMLRLLLRPGATYEQEREAFAPFDRLVAPHEGMRREVVDILSRAVARAIPAYVLVNNKAEGSAPLTIEALAEMAART